MPPTGELTTERTLHCMICNTFSTDSLQQICDHLETDRSEFFKKKTLII